MPNSDARTPRYIGTHSVRYAAAAMRRTVLEEIVVTARKRLDYGEDRDRNGARPGIRGVQAQNQASLRQQVGRGFLTPSREAQSELAISREQAIAVLALLVPAYSTRSASSASVSGSHFARSFLTSL